MENIKLCKNCGKEHNGTYGKGDFCSLHCSRSYSGKLTKQHSKGVKRPKVSYVCKYCHQSILGKVNYRNHLPKCPKNFGRKSRKVDGWTCSTCNQSFRTRNLLVEHRKITNCDGKGRSQYHPLIDFTCQFCKKEFLQRRKEYKTQHENHCECNPNAVKYKGHPHTEQTKQKLSMSAKKHNFGGWHTSKVIEYNGIKLDSSYELLLAQNLDSCGIKWERPDPFLYKLDGEEHRYYPDFFLPDYKVYVDTKNDYLINYVNPRFGITDIEKIRLVEQQNNIKVLVLDKDNLSWSSIQKLI